MDGLVKGNINSTHNTRKKFEQTDRIRESILSTDNTLQFLLDMIYQQCDQWDFNNYLAHACYVNLDKKNKPSEIDSDDMSENTDKDSDQYD